MANSGDISFNSIPRFRDWFSLILDLVSFSMKRTIFRVTLFAAAVALITTSCTKYIDNPTVTGKVQVTTYAGNGSAGSANGPWLQSSFDEPYALAVDTLGNIYVADAFNNRIRLISPVFGVSYFGGNTPADSGNSVPNITAFGSPVGIAIDYTGTIYVTDNVETWITKISPSGVVTTFAGGGRAGQNGLGMTAGFYGPYGLAVDLNRNLYVADFDGAEIRKISPFGLVTTLAGTGALGRLDGAGTVATFNGPFGVAVNAAGIVYVADELNNLIREISPLGVVTTLAGSGSAGSQDGLGVFASFNNPCGIAVDRQGNIYVSDSKNNKIRKIDPAGGVSTLAGTGQPGSADGGYTTATFNNPIGIAVDSAGNVYVADTGNNLIRKISQ